MKVMLFISRILSYSLFVFSKKAHPIVRAAIYKHQTLIMPTSNKLVSALINSNTHLKIKASLRKKSLHP